MRILTGKIYSGVSQLKKKKQKQEKSLPVDEIHDDKWPELALSIK